MSDISYFESRRGIITCTPEEAFNFVTDLRNFERFAQENSVTNWQAERDSGSFTVSMVGTVSFRLSEKEAYNKVVYKGDALKKNDFSLVLTIDDKDNDKAEVKVSLYADLNPILKMMAAKPITLFLETLIKEMEGFRGWKDSIEYIQPL
jgi:carbon monoxide dehydrogenase subunit G